MMDACGIVIVPWNESISCPHSHLVTIGAALERLSTTLNPLKIIDVLVFLVTTTTVQ